MANTFAFTDGQLDPPADFAAVDGLSSELGVPLPSDYLDFLRQHDGGEGFVGDNYIVLWKAGELADFNREYEVEVYVPGVLLFGSDGGGEGFGFDTQSEGMPIVRLPFVGMERRYATPVAESFTAFLAQLAEPS